MLNQRWSGIYPLRPAVLCGSGLLAGRLYEEGTLLDSYSTGAFGFDGESTTDFASLYGVLRLNSKTSLLGRYSFGRTNASSLTSALVRSFDSLQSDGFALGLAVQGGLAELSDVSACGSN